MKVSGQLDERNLIVALKNGSEKSFGQLYHIYVSKLYKYVYGYMKSEDVTKDIVQETFIRIWTHRENLNPELSFKQYLFTLSYHLLVREFRYQMRSNSMEEYVAYISEFHTSADNISEVVEFNQFEFYWIWQRIN